MLNNNYIYVCHGKIEKEFELECVPMNWPIGEGESFQVLMMRRMILMMRMRDNLYARR